MAVRKNFNGGYSYQDLFDAQDALDEGKIKDLKVGDIVTKTVLPWYKRDGSVYTEETSPLMANKNNLGSILGQEKEIGSYKDTMAQRQKLLKQGSGMSQSILGGSVI